MRRLIVVVGVMALVLALSTVASASSHLRYCDKPGPSGAFVSATPGVRCSTARYVSRRMATPACVNRRRCQARGFTCRSYWDGSYAHPFMYSHHGICTARRHRRIVFDWS